ncbi:MAG: NAD-dependent protein deacetylase [Gammaproteobacteria bacterium]|nr:NAD-dependent protein deacetylase [Gammaproteobacteria bacterium]
MAFEAAQALAAFIRQENPVCVLTGAGCSTGSGIFDYRDAQGEWKRPQPVLLDDFLNSTTARRRYWARSMLGWPRFAAARPNVAHIGIAQLEQRGLVSSVITQNVDDLHESAGQVNVIALHGSLRTATCIDCATVFDRHILQTQLELNNPRFLGAAVTPDAGGESFYQIDIDETFQVPDCAQCGGVLKPDVVFFGGNLRHDVKANANSAVTNAQSLLVIGSSLMVYSSFRLVKLAHQLGKPIAILGLGVTRGDSLAEHVLRAEVATTFEELMSYLQF